MKKKNKSRNKKVAIFGGVSLVALVVAMVLMAMGMSKAVEEIENTAISRKPEAVLASAGVADETDVSLPVAYYDQRADECVNLYDNALKDVLESRQFEWSKCEYRNKGLEQGLVEFELGEDYLPVAVGGSLLPDRGVKSENFGRWYSAVEGKSANYAGLLQMKYKSEGAEFSYDDEAFYPLDSVEFSKGDFVNNGPHNHLFTMNFAVPFMVTADGNEYFEISADDDTFVFVGDKLAVDMGGVHETTTGRFMINKAGEVYTAVNDEEFAYSGITVEAQDNSIVRIFHADRDSDDSVFRVLFHGMNLLVTNTTLADNTDGVQIAYDPTDPSYVAPLGETSVFRPDNTKGLIVMATVEGALLLVLAVLAAGVACFVVRTRKK